MAVSKCPCSTFSNLMFKQMPSSHWFLSINSQYLRPYWLLQKTSEHTKIQRYKATKIHTLTPLTYELFFQNSSIMGQRGNLRALARICKLVSYFQRSSLIPKTSAHFNPLFETFSSHQLVTASKHTTAEYYNGDCEIPLNNTE